MNELEIKKNFVEELGTTIKKYFSRVEDVHYDAFQLPSGVEEFLVVDFVGGYSNARCCSCNSLEAILDELPRLCSGDYFDEVNIYKFYVENCKQI